MIDFIQQYGVPPAEAEGVIVPGSVPVFVFGNPDTTLATVGINPGPKEFESSKRHPWRWGEQTTERRIGDGVSSSLARRIADHYSNYFGLGNWKADSFWQSNSTLLPSGFCYRSGTASHIDIVPWATKDVWSGVPSEMRDTLTAESGHMLQDLLTGPLKNVDTLVVRGVSATGVLGCVLAAWDGDIPWQKERPHHRVLSCEVSFAGRQILVLAYNQFRTLASNEIEWLHTRYAEWVHGR